MGQAGLAPLTKRRRTRYLLRMTDAARLDEVDLSPPAIAATGSWIYRHKLPTRIWHWVNTVAVIVMIGSGLMISNAHPHLYWGQYGANFDPCLAASCRAFPAG